MDCRLDLAERLAVELRRYGLERHLEGLRAYYAATRAGAKAEWGDSHVRLLAEVFQVVEGLEVRPAGVGCCAGYHARTELSVGDRYVLRCSGCSRAWLVLVRGSTGQNPPI
jgi:hypothetical protein